MATVTISSTPAQVTAADTNDNVLQIDAPIAGDSLYGGLEFTIEVKTGSFQFSSGAVISAENPTYSAGDKLVISLSPDSKLHFVAGNTSDVFIIAR